jgi:hypothetical protein
MLELGFFIMFDERLGIISNEASKNKVFIRLVEEEIYGTFYFFSETIVFKNDSRRAVFISPSDKDLICANI